MGQKFWNLGIVRRVNGYFKPGKQTPPPNTNCLLPDVVHQNAITAVRHLGGDISNELHVLGQHQLQFGVFKGKTFLWLLENAPGYAGYMALSMERETQTATPLSKNKFLFKNYVQQFKEGVQLIKTKKAEQKKSGGKVSSAVSQLMNKKIPASVAAKKAVALTSGSACPAARPTIPPTQRTSTPTTQTSTPPTQTSTPPPQEDLTDTELLAAERLGLLQTEGNLLDNPSK